MKQTRNFKIWFDPCQNYKDQRFRSALRANGSDAPTTPPPAKSDSGSGGSCGCFGFFIIVILLCLGLGLIFKNLYIQPPKASVEGHKVGNSTILLAGTDKSGINTDAIMLVNFCSSEQRISLMSIPRDTRVDSTYKPHKINGAYAANGMGEKGMYWLSDYIRQCVGFQPDGFVLVDVDCFVEVVDILGGVNYDVPVSMHYDDPSQDLHIHLDPGLQHLDGTEAMGLVRFRKDYLMQDLQRVAVQRDFLKTAAEQWREQKDYLSVYKAFQVVQEHSLTNLSTSNLLWMLQCVANWGIENFEMMTIPYDKNTNKDYYIYIKEDEEYLQIINEYFNPYEDPVGFDDLNIVKPQG